MDTFDLYKLKIFSYSRGHFLVFPWPFFSYSRGHLYPYSTQNMTGYDETRERKKLFDSVELWYDTRSN